MDASKSLGVYYQYPLHWTMQIFSKMIKNVFPRATGPCLFILVSPVWKHLSSAQTISDCCHLPYLWRHVSNSFSQWIWVNKRFRFHVNYGLPWLTFCCMEKKYPLATGIKEIHLGGSRVSKSLTNFVIAVAFFVIKALQRTSCFTASLWFRPVRMFPLEYLQSFILQFLNQTDLFD